MCNYNRFYYVYSSCLDPSAHFFKTTTDGDMHNRCARAPHESYIVVAGRCPLC